MHGHDSHAAGFLLLEILVALGITAVAILGILSSLRVTAAAAAFSDDLDKTRVALEDAADLLRRTTFRGIHSRFQGARIAVPGLVGVDGGEAAILVECFVNERAIPEEFGPVLDIDGQGGLETADCSATYCILPVRLSLSHESPQGPVRRELYLIIEPGK